MQVEPWRKYLLSRSCSCALNCQPYERSSVLNKKINIFFLNLDISEKATQLGKIGK